MAQRGRPKKEKVEVKSNEQISSNDYLQEVFGSKVFNGVNSNQLLDVSTQVIVGLLLGSSGNYGNMMSKKAVIIAKELIAEVEKG